MAVFEQNRINIDFKGFIGNKCTVLNHKTTMKPQRLRKVEESQVEILASPTTELPPWQQANKRDQLRLYSILQNLTSLVHFGKDFMIRAVLTHVLAVC